MTVTRVEDGLMAKENSAFIAFYTKPYHHYQTNEECRNWGEKAWFAKIPLLGVMHRWDGSLGFVGGKVDKNETLLESAIRECKEEINGEIKESQLKLLCSHEMKGQNTHLFICEVTPDDIYELQKKSVTSEHCKIESAGYSVIHLVAGAKDNLLKSPWAGTGKEELEILLNSDFFEQYSHEVNEF